MPGRNLFAAAVALAALGVLAAAFTTDGFRRASPDDRSTSAARALSASQRDDVRGVVRQYLTENPDVIVEALQAMQARQEASERARTKQALSVHRDALTSAAGDPAIGPATASVTIVEFFDYQCPYCKRMTDGLMALAAQDPDLRIVFKEFPILGDESVAASRAALASDKQGRYAEFHVALMAHRGKLTLPAIEQAALNVGLDLERLRRDMQAPDVEAKVQTNYALAQALGVSGTPAFVIGNQLIPGAVATERLRDLVAKVRAGES